MEKCIICGNENIKKTKVKIAPFVKHRMYDDAQSETMLVYCPECNFCCSEIRPNGEQMSKYYQNYMEKEYNDERYEYEPTYEDIRKEYKKFGGRKNELKQRKKMMETCFAKYINFNEIKTILDWGGARGENILAKFKKAEKFVYDIDNTEPVKGVKKITKDEIKDYKWDFIMCCHMLEHVPNPIKDINEIISNLSLGSYLYVELPFEKYFLDAAKSGDNIYLHEHINSYRRTTLLKIFDRPDFKILENKLKYTNCYIGQSAVMYILVQKVESKENIEPIEQPLQINRNKLSSYFKIKTATPQFRDRLNSLINELASKKVLIYGAGEGFKTLNEEYELTKNLDIVAISDKKYEENNPELFLKHSTIAPDEIQEYKFDYILVTNENYKSIVKFLIEILLIPPEKIKTIFFETINDERSE